MRVPFLSVCIAACSSSPGTGVAGFKNGVGVYRGHTGAVVGVAWSLDGTKINGAPLASFAHGASSQPWGDGVFGVAFSPDDKRVATGGADNTVRVWSASTGAAAQKDTEPKNVVWTVAWSPDGTRLASASQDGTVVVWQP